MFELFSEETSKNPHLVYEHARRAGPVLHDAANDLWLLLGYEEVKRALTDHAEFGSQVADGEPARWLLFVDPPRHTELRGLVSRAFTSASVAALEARIIELCSELLDAVSHEERIELVDAFTLPLPMMVIAELLGAPSSDWRLFRRWSDAMVGLASTIFGGQRAERAAQAYTEAAAEMRDYVAELLRVRRAAPRPDLLSRLLQTELDGARLSEDEIAAFFQLLLLAGHETTTNLIGSSVLEWIEHPSVLPALRAHPEHIPSFVEEVLRHRSPLQVMFRITKQDVQIAERTIPAGSVVLAVIGAANRDPEQFERPDTFDPGRSPNPHLAFGHGIHFCIGAPLARLEARIATNALAGRYESFELDGAWKPRGAFHVHGPSELPVRVRRR